MTDMKKIAKYFFVAAASLAAMSCVKELNVEERPVQLTGKAYVFSAEFDAETKTVLDEDTMTPMWFGDENGNEYITVMEPGSVNTYVAEGIYEPTAEVTFVMAENGGTGLKGNAAFAVSPAGAWKCFDNADSTGVTVTYNKNQVAYADTYDPAGPVAVAYNDDLEANPNFTFKNASALLKFQITADSDPVTSVKFYSLGGEPLAGEMHLMVKADSAMIVPAKGASSWVEIEGLYGSELEPETDYYIAVAPSLLSKGIGFQFNDREDVQTFTISKEINIERNKIYDLGLFRYEASNDNKWYLMGNVEEGVANNFANVMFQAAGNNLVAENVTFAKGQSFKIYNPAQGVVYYPNAEESVAAETWVDLTEDAFYACPKAGTYDVYVDFVDEVITGVALVAPGEEAPEYLLPELGYYTWVDDSQVEWGGSVYEYAISLDEYEMVYADSYDANMAGMPAEYFDPTMTGKWNILGIYTDIQYFPTHATAGEFRCQSVQAAGGVGPLSAEEGEVMYHIVRYSDIVDGGMNVFSTSQMYDEEGNEIPVLDADGNPLMVWVDWMEDYMPVVYSGIGGLSNFDENWISIPLSVSLSKTDLEFAVPVPTTGQFVWSSYLSEYDEETEEEVVFENCMKMFDLGVSEPGVIRIASYYDQLAADPMTGETYEWADPRLAGTWLTQMRFDNYEIVPIGTTGGEIRIYNEYVSERGQTVTEYYLIYYSNYTYKSMIALHSPYEIVDSEGNPIPVEGTDAYWQGLGIESQDWWTGGSVPVGMYDAEMYGMSGEAVDAPATPDGAQWTFFWEAFGVTSVIDLGVTTPGYFSIAYSMAEAYGADNLPEELQEAYMQYAAWEYEIIPDEENPGCGQLNLVSYNMYEEKQVAEGYYTDYNGTMFLYTNEMLGIMEAPVFMGRDIYVYIEQGGALM